MKLNNGMSPKPCLLYSRPLVSDKTATRTDTNHRQLFHLSFVNINTFPDTMNRDEIMSLRR